MWGAESRFGGERLNFDEHRARAFHERGDRRTRRAGRAAGEKRGGRIGDRLEPRSRHLKDADLIDRAKSVFDRAQNSGVERRLAFEIQNGIDDMFERLGSGDAAAFGHVAHEDDRRP